MTTDELARLQLDYPALQRRLIRLEQELCDERSRTRGLQMRVSMLEGRLTPMPTIDAFAPVERDDPLWMED